MDPDLPDTPPEGNFAALVTRHAVTHPERLALVVPPPAGEAGEVETATYGELAERIAGFAAGLRAEGLRPGDRVVVLFPLSVDLYALVLALFAAGMTAVFVDAGMGPARINRALARSRAKAIVSARRLLRYRFALPALWRMRCYSVDSAGAGLRDFARLRGAPASGCEPVPRSEDDECLVTFTSGSTGAPKGADRTHGLLTRQHLALREQEEIHALEGAVDMPCFPVAALHDLCMGYTCVLPPVDFRHVAGADARAVVAHARRWGVDRILGAPAYMGRLTGHLLGAGETMPEIRSVGVGGAPVPRGLCADILAVFPEAASAVVYGSTEAEPISHVWMQDVVAVDGEGHLVGAPVDCAEVALVDLLDGDSPVLDDRGLDPYRVAPGDCGEVVVRGPHVNRGYVDDPAANRRTKLVCPDGQFWHRTGDVARLDPEGRLWLLGRLADVVRRDGRILHPLPIEAAVNAAPCVRASALVAHRRFPEGEFAVALDGEGSEVPDEVSRVLGERGAGGVPVTVVGEIPMDGRHNSKVDRPTLRRRLARRRRT